jgi:iron complex outermembrane receptor protein
VVASLYDQKKDLSRTAVPTNGLDAGLGAVRPGGQLTDAAGTGWHNLDARGTWRLGAHTLDAGLHHDRYQLKSATFGTNAAPIADWLTSDTGTLNTNSFGKTQTDAVYLQDAWQIGPQWLLMAGGRQERWRAFDGSNYNAGNAAPNPKNLVYGDRRLSHFSPKLSVSYRHRPRWPCAHRWARACATPPWPRCSRPSTVRTASASTTPTCGRSRSARRNGCCSSNCPTACCAVRTSTRTSATH